jgi:hypothetical protein
MPVQTRDTHLQCQDGSRTREYRVIGNQVETRKLGPTSKFDLSIDDSWWPLTPAQLSSHVMRNTAVARWLEYRMGWRRLLRACVGEYEVAAESTSSTEFREYQSVGSH